MGCWRCRVRFLPLTTFNYIKLHVNFKIGALAISESVEVSDTKTRGLVTKALYFII